MKISMPAICPNGDLFEPAFNANFRERQSMGDDLEGLSDQEITARALETKLEGIMQSRQWLLAQRRVYEGNRNTAEQQDAIAVIDEMLAAYDRVLKQLSALIRRARIHEV